ncbi:MAG: hypothetical protein B6U72_05535, partial [Candidatus Altiarchaeales archaeon ex4484_2]
MKLKNKKHIKATILLLTSIIAASMLIPAMDGFTINTDKKSYLPSEDVYVVVSGPSHTRFDVAILNPEGRFVHSDSSQTNVNGLSYMHLNGFTKPGIYTITLDSGGDILMEHFGVFDLSQISLTTTTTKTTTPSQSTSTATTTSTYSVTSTATTTDTYSVTSTPTSTTPTYTGPAAIVVSVDFINDSINPPAPEMKENRMMIQKTSSHTTKCSKNKFTSSIHSPTATLIDPGGRPMNFTDAAEFRWMNNSFNLSWLNYSLGIKTFAIYNRTRYSFDEMQDMFPGVKTDAVVSDYGEAYKYALNISDIPLPLADHLDYIGLELADLDGFTWNDVRKTGHGVTLNNEIYLGFNDLLNKYTLSIVNASTILVGGVGNKTNLWLDPTIQLQTADTENLWDAPVYGRAGFTGNNYGGSTSLYLWDRTTRRIRTYIKFNISSIPLSVSIDDAQLCLYIYNNGATASASVYHIYDYTWDGENEGTITWNNQVCGTGFDDSTDCNLTAEDTQNTNAVGWFCWNVTKMVSRDYGDGDANISMALKTPETGNNALDRYCSKEATAGSPSGCSVARRPYLNVTYTDNTPPDYSGITQSPSGNPGYGNPVQCNATWTDNIALSKVYFRSNYSGSWQNYSASNDGSTYYYTIPVSQLPAGKNVGWNFWANDSSDNWNKSMPTQPFTVQKANTTINLYLNGTDGDESYYQNDSANFTVILSAFGKTVELWTNLSGVMQLWDTGPSPLENITQLDYGYGTYLIKANFSGDENYTASEKIHYLTIAQDPIKPNITDVSPINQTYGLGAYIVIQANVTDNIAVDTVLVNITPPSGSPELYVMTNNSPDIYQHSFWGWDTGTYYYEIIANDSSGNTRIYHPYIYVYGNATLNVYTEEYTYSLQEDVNLTPAQNWTSSDLEGGVIEKKAQLEEPGWDGLTYDDFDNGNWGNWVNGGADCIMSTDRHYCGTTVHSVNLQDNTATSYTELSSGLDLETPGYTNLSVDFWAYYNSIEAGECLDLSCDGNVVWTYCANEEGTEGTWLHQNVNIRNGTDCIFDTSVIIRFEAEFGNDWDDVWLDCINLTATTGPTPDTETNTSYTTYNDAFPGNFSDITRLTATVYVSSYNNSGSTARGNNDPDLQLELYDGSDWVIVGNLSVNETGNVSISTTNSAILNAWETVGNRDLRIIGINFDYYNSSNIDEINWTGVWVRLYSGSMLLNTGSSNISGYLLMKVERNGSWIHVETIINDTNTSTLRNITSGTYLDLAAIWNAVPWNTDSQPSGTYRVYAALLDNESNVLQGDDGDPIENYDVFEITVFGTINATPETVGYGQTVLISAEVLDPTTDKVFVYISRPGEGFNGYEMTNVSGTLYQYNYSNTWIWGNYSYYIWVNNSAGFNSTTSTYQFYVRANATLAVKTVNDSYGPQEDVNLEANETSWWNNSYRYRKQLNVTNVNDTLTMEEGYSVKFTLDTETLVNEGKLQADGSDLRVLWYNTTDSSWVDLDRINESGFNSTSTEIWFATKENISASSSDGNYYIYYDSSSASNPLTNRSRIYVWWDDFSTNTLSKYNLSKWVDIHGGAALYTNPTYDAVNKRVTYDTGDNHASDMYPTGVTVKDFVLELDYYVTGSYPTNATFAFIGRMENPGQASTHYYFDYSASVYSSPGISIDTWTQGERNHNIYDEAIDYWFPWNMLHNIKYAIYSDIHKVWINGEVTDNPDLYAIDNTHMSAGRFGVAPAQAIGWLDNFKVRKFIGQDPTITLSSEDDRLESRVSNHGSTNISGYLEMRVQRFSGGSWVNFESSFMNDRVPPQTLRNISSSGVLMLDGIWNPAGWDTDLNPPGLYRAFVELTDPSGNTLKNDDGSLIRGWYNLTIISSELRLTEIEHENNYTAGLDEYETGDNIAWINITVTNYNATSINASTTLNVLDSSSNTISWGPQTETKYCGNLSINESCERKFDNTSVGYPVPLTATSGGYNFFWNVTMKSETGTTTHNNSLTFMLHHIPDNLSSTIDPDKIFQNQSAVYNFTITNPWSKNLTNITVTLNCPNLTGINCSCIATGLPYCNLTYLNPLASYTLSFDITTNGTPAGDYYMNTTLNYTNPGLEFHSWPDQQNQLLRIRIPGQFVEIISWPNNITREGYGNISGYSNNTLGSPMTNVTLNWTLSYGWSNYTGNLSQFDDNQTPGEMMWNNITAYVNISAELGPQTVQLRSNSEEGYEDWDTETIIVYARTYINNLQSNDSDPNRGDDIKVSGRLVLDNGTALSGRDVSVYDETDNTPLGSDLTDATGWFHVYYQIPAGASVGNHVLNATFDGLLTSYYLGAFNTTNITVHDKPLILNVTDYPDPQGYGYNVTLEANVTDLEGVDTVTVCVTPPSAGQTCYVMTNYTADLYQYNYSNTWIWGNHSYYIWANDTAGKVSQSSAYTFYIGANIVLNVKTMNDTYGSNEDVNFTSMESWWNYSWEYRRQINVTENNNTALTDYVVSITLDTQTLISQGKMQADCDDIRVVQNDTLLNYSVRNVTCNTNETIIEFEVDVNANSYADDIYIYYGNPSTENNEAIVGYHTDANTVFLYHFVEGSGTKVVDYSGNGNNATLERGPSWVTSPVRFGEYAIDLPGDNEYIEEGTSMDVDDGTLEMWFRLDEEFNSSAQNSQGIFGIWSAANAHLEVSLCGNDRTDANCNDGGLMFKTEAAGTGTDYCASNKVQWNANQWYHVAVTWDGATRNIYIDGELDSSCADNGISNFPAADLWIGAAQIDQINADPVKYLKGVVDEVRGSNIARTPTGFLVRENEPNVSLTSEQTYDNQSLIYDDHHAAVKGYLLMKVQRYEGGGWVDVDRDNPVVNDSTPRSLSGYSYLALDSIWAPPGWNTDKEPAGRYRVYAAFTDPYGNILKNDDSSLIYDTHEFNITQPSSIIQLQELRIYDVTSAADRKGDTSFLMGNGTNTTFTLFTNKVYRLEVRVWNNDTSEDNWSITSLDQIYHENLNETWGINETDEIWYNNVSHNLTGGNWSNRRVTWNTSLNGTLKLNDTLTLYYIFNITTGKTENYQVHFMLNDTQFTLEDYSLYDIVVSESQPPGLYSFIYDTTKDLIHRGESLNVFARWDETIGQALAEYNSTTPGLENHSISLPNPNPQNWTNHTLTSNTSWILGTHKVKIYAADLNTNWNNTLPYFSFDVWGWSSVTDSHLGNYTIVNGSSATIYCRVTSDNGSALSGYNVSFHNSSSSMGVNQTNATGWASWTFIDSSLGYENITCNITDYGAIYHNDSANNYRIEILRTIETKPPWYVNVTQNASKVHRGEDILFSAYWYDDVWLDYAWLESNETGVWLNNSLVSANHIDDSEGLVEFYASIPADAKLGPMAWRIYANDTSSNVNVTSPINHTEIWGYTIINKSSLSPNPIYVNNTTTMSCQIVDYHNGSPISSYNVSFYSNESGYMGVNQTNASGWATWTFIDNTSGWERITCNITSDATKYYDPHDPSSVFIDLRAAMPGEDTAPPGAVIYGLNASWIWKGQSVYAYAEWTENITESNITYNTTSPALDVFPTETVVENQTNHTIQSNSSWIVGIHYVKINASDYWGNWNNTLQYLNFTVWGRSKVGWHSPNTTEYRGTVSLRCRVYDKDGGYGISNYPVDFYNGSWDYLDTVNTNASGIATYNWSAQNELVGSKTFHCMINDNGYYNTTNADDDDVGTFDLLGRLNASIDYPTSGLIFHRGETIDLNSTTRDENSVIVTPVTAAWYNSTWGNIANGEDTTWNIPQGYGVGPETLYLNASKQYYENSSSNLTIYVWGYSNITWISPVSGSNASQGSTVSLVCRVRDNNTGSGIQNYPVRFYYRNSTEAGFHYIGLDDSNSTGHAVYGWNTAGLPLDNYTTKCNITDNSTIYYNITSDNEANATIELVTSAGVLEVQLILPPYIPGLGNASKNGGYKIGQGKEFIISANVTCRNANCGNTQGTVRYNASGAVPDKAINTTPDTPFYITDAPAQNPKSCSNNPLDVNESCILNWTINATGAILSHWRIDVLFSAAGATSNNTNYTNIEITKVLILILSNDTI